MPDICLPSLGAEMDEGTLLEWYVKAGDRIEYGEIIALLDTEKAEIEMEAYEAGVIESLLIGPGDTVAVGTPVARLAESEATSCAPPTPKTPVSPTSPAPCQTGEPLEPIPAAPSPPPPPAPARGRDVAAADAPDDRSAPQRPPPGAAEQRRPRATPLARRLARERGVDLDRLSGSGPHGAIVESDVPTAPSASTRPPASATPTGSTTPAAPATSPTPAASTTPPASTTPRTPDRVGRRREIIAAAMERSKREIPHYYLSTTIEIQETVERLEAHNHDHGVHDRILLAALLIKSVADAAQRFPEFNGHWRAGGFEPAASVDLGMVVSLRTGGLVVPTFRNAGERTVPDLMAELRDVVARARAGRLRSGELSDATITLTSLGDRGAESIFGVIYPPQVAIVGFGGVHRVPWVVGDLLGTRSAIQASLAADHRASDGQQGSRFLDQISRSLRDPENL